MEVSQAARLMKTHKPNPVRTIKPKANPPILIFRRCVECNTVTATSDKEWPLIKCDVVIGLALGDESGNIGLSRCGGNLKRIRLHEEKA